MCYTNSGFFISKELLTEGCVMPKVGIGLLPCVSKSNGSANSQLTETADF